eukprot:TRINITY_DN11309_c0_g1_i3.p1 TRINITY_DN11309_c0_g1~~TRINITY_DN11309_c0_g1_i3.p1  ORF type:complete len:1540 (+),score=400.41 TRINITY_DN11309_c0_g1_i3:253-4620(+)
MAQKTKAAPIKLEKDRFRRRLTNDYSLLDASDKQARHDDSVCSCLPPTQKGDVGCGPACINRIMFAECNPSSCPCGEQCSNRRFQRREWCPNLKVFPTAHKGWGVQATDHIPKGTFILEYVGEVMTVDQYAERVATEYEGARDHFHCLNLDGGLVIDAGQTGSDARFLNHSCEPNCVIEKWSVLGRWSVGIFADRDIEEGEELTYDYNFQSFNEDVKCYCGSAKCRGYIRAKPRDEEQHTRARERRLTPHQITVAKVMDDDMLYKPFVWQFFKDLDRVAEYQPLNIRQIKALARSKHLPTRCLRKLYTLQLARQQAEVDKAAKAQQHHDDAQLYITVFQNRLKAWQAGRSRVRSRRTQDVSDSRPEWDIDRRVAMATVFQSFMAQLKALEHNDVEVLGSMKLPSHRRFPDYYELIQSPIDGDAILRKIEDGAYHNQKMFHHDLELIWKNAQQYNRPRTPIYKLSVKLENYVRQHWKEDVLYAIEQSINLLRAADDNTIEEDEVEGHFRCLCQTTLEDYPSVECPGCKTWQHYACMRISKEQADSDDYRCWRCTPRQLGRDVPLIEYPEKETETTEARLQRSLQLKEEYKEMEVQLKKLERERQEFYQVECKDRRRKHKRMTEMLSRHLAKKEKLENDIERRERKLKNLYNIIEQLQAQIEARVEEIEDYYTKLSVPTQVVAQPSASQSTSSMAKLAPAQALPTASLDELLAAANNCGLVNNGQSTLPLPESQQTTLAPSSSSASLLNGSICTSQTSSAAAGTSSTGQPVGHAGLGGNGLASEIRPTSDVSCTATPSTDTQPTRTPAGVPQNGAVGAMPTCTDSAPAKVAAQAQVLASNGTPGNAHGPSATSRNNTTACTAAPGASSTASAPQQVVATMPLSALTNGLAKATPLAHSAQSTPVQPNAPIGQALQPAASMVPAQTATAITLQQPVTTIPLSSMNTPIDNSISSNASSHMPGRPLSVSEAILASRAPAHSSQTLSFRASIVNPNAIASSMASAPWQPSTQTINLPTLVVNEPTRLPPQAVPPEWTQRLENLTQEVDELEEEIRELKQEQAEHEHDAKITKTTQESLTATKQNLEAGWAEMRIKDAGIKTLVKTMVAHQAKQAAVGMSYLRVDAMRDGKRIPVRLNDFVIVKLKPEASATKSAEKAGENDDHDDKDDKGGTTNAAATATQNGQRSGADEKDDNGDVQPARKRAKSTRRARPSKRDSPKGKARSKNKGKSQAATQAGEADAQDAGGNLQIMQVKNILRMPEGNTTFSGPVYMFPKSTRHHIGQKFYPQEVVYTTNQLAAREDEIEAVCWVLSKVQYCNGRPKEVTTEELVYVVDRSYKLSGHSWGKMPASKTYLYDEHPSVWNKLEERLELKRTESTGNEARANVPLPKVQVKRKNKKAARKPSSDDKAKRTPSHEEQLELKRDHLLKLATKLLPGKLDGIDASYLFSSRVSKRAISGAE